MSFDALRDSCNFGPILVDKSLIPEALIHYDRIIACVGAFDDGRPHRLLTAKITLRSPTFGTDREVVTTAAITRLPIGIKCVISNSLYKEHPDLTDIIMVRKLSSPQHENKLSDSAKMDVLLSPYIIGAQCSTGADKDLNLTANDLINSYSPQARPLIQFDSDLAQTATRPQRNSTDYVTDG